jgi:arabinofuranan 3-O-arabinosyltransferase
VPVSPLVLRVRTAAVCLLLTLLAFVQSPGRLAIDTKVDLTADPLGFLARALHLWDPQAAFGQLQNQATGYLFPMGPFFVLGHLVGLPGWAVQRFWWAALMVAAYLGFVRVAERLVIGSPLTRALLGIAFAASPRVATLLGSSSIEALPLALSPWVLLPVIGGVQGRLNPRRAGTLSGVAVLCIGGVNAVATAAALPVAGLLILTAARGRLRLRLAAWWTGSVLLATLWWLIPLALLGRYSPPFLDYIESSTVTTGVTSLSEALRGTSDWIGFLATGRGPVLPSAWRLLTDPNTILHTFLLAGLGLWGFTRRDLPHRTWLLLSVLLGMTLVTMGHVSSVDGVLAPQLREALDGALAPFRNVHKFDATLRLPLMLAACHGASRLRLPVARMAGALTGVVVVSVVSPLALGQAVPSGGYQRIPAWWQQTADYVAAQHVPGRTLLVPGSAFADYLWGSTGDEPMQPLASSPWAVRNGIPLAPAGNIRLLDAVESRLRSGHGSLGLSEALRRSGVGLLVVRNDLDRGVTGSPRSVVLHQALQESPGVERIAAFGPLIGRGVDASPLYDSGLDLTYQAVEVYRVGSGGARADGYPASTALTVSGGPEALLDAADRGLVAGRATTLAGQDAVPGGSTTELVTDTLRRAEVPFSALPKDPATLAADDPFRLVRAAHDYLPVTGRETVAKALGVRRIRASSSGSDVNAVVLPGAQYAPYAALDRDPSTYWHSGALNRAAGQWLQLDLLEPTLVDVVHLRFKTGAPWADVSAVTVTTDAGSRTTPLVTGEADQEIAAAPGYTSRVRVTFSAVRGGGTGTAVAVRELSVNRVLVGQALALPKAAAGAAFLLSAGPERLEGCVRVGTRPLCAPDLVTPAEPVAGIDRLLTLSSPAVYGVSATLRSRAGSALDRLLDVGRPLQVSASSSLTSDPASRPAVVVDRDLGTGWVAGATDRAPTLTLRWAAPRTLSRLQLVVDQALAASRPRAVTVVAAGRSQRVAVDSTGRVAFAPVRTTSVVLRFDPKPSRYSLQLGTFRPLPVGVSELVVPALDGLRVPVDRARRIAVGCDDGPVLDIDGTRLRTSVRTSVGALVDRAPITAQACDAAVDLRAGLRHVVLGASRLLEPVTLFLATPDGTGPAVGEARSVQPRHWGRESREVAVGAGPATVLVVHENANAGWRATLDGHELTPLVVDGWQQAWLVPAGGQGTVALSYGPGRVYDVGLVVGALLVLLLLGLAATPSLTPSVPRSAPGEASRTGLVLSGGLFLLLGGPVGIGALVLARLLRRWAAWLVGAGVLGAAAVGILHRWPTGRGAQSALSQVLVLVALAAAASAATQRDERALDDEVADSGDTEGHADRDEPGGEEPSVERPA